MTAKEFDNTRWCKDMTIKYWYGTHQLKGVDFKNRKLLLNYHGWVKHLKCEIVGEQK